MMMPFFIKYIHLLALVAAALLLAGCAATPKFPAGATVPPAHTIPSAIREAPPDNLHLAEVRDNADAHVGTTVRWGGTIESVQDQEHGTWIRIEERALDEYGKPNPGSPSAGRFVAQLSDSLDSSTYAEGREITVAGPLKGKVDESKARHLSKLPLVEVEEHYLWDRDEAYAFFPRHYRYYPYRYYPYHYYPYRYYPYHPYRRYGYYPYYRFGFHFGHGHHHRHHHGFHFGHGRHHGFHFGLHGFHFD